VDDLNIIGHTKDIDEARNHLKMEFKIKDLGKTKIYLGLELEQLHILVFSYTSLLTSRKYWKS
jgi:hypothetical protein